MSVNTLTVNFTPPIPTPANGYRLKYRPIGSSGAYTTVDNVIPVGSTITITGLDATVTGWEGTIESKCGSAYYSVVASFNTNTFCNCPAGFTAVGTNDNCQRVTTVAATLNPGGALTACHFTSTVYCQFGTIFYQPGGYGTNGVFTTTPTYLKTSAVGGTYSGSLWGNVAGNTTNGRLNRTGIWKCLDQNYTTIPLGFSRQITIGTTKTYYIGMGADNLATIKINGVNIVAQNPTALGTSLSAGVDVAFKYWHVYPVELSAGINLLEITGTNTGGIGVFGCEIYDATEAQLIACTTEAALVPYIVFTTGDISGVPSGQKVVDNDPFDVGSYNCTAYPGYNLVKEGSSYYCKLIENAACGSDGGL